MSAGHIVYREVHGSGRLPPPRASDEGWWPPRRKRHWTLLRVLGVFGIIVLSAALGVLLAFVLAAP